MRVSLCVFVFVFAKTGEGIDFGNPYSRLDKKTDTQFQVPVPFGHIFQEGFGDPFSSRKQPIDMLELSMRTPKNRKEALEILKTANKKDIFFIKPVSKMLRNPSPKDEMLLERFIRPQKETNQTRLKWYDLATIQGRNAMLPPKHQYIPKKKTLVGAPSLPTSPITFGKQPFFSKNSFQLIADQPEMLTNWTTCDEFAIGAVFSPKDVVNLKWTPFFTWDDEGKGNAIEHTFEYPTNKLVNSYHAKYGKLLNKTVDWSKTKLLMKVIGQYEALLIAADKKGLFDVIPKHDVPDVITPNIRLPMLSLRMKIEDPYLVLTFCEHHLATVMAISGNGPTDAQEMMAEAATIKFVGSGRPVWRDFQAERDRIEAIKEAKTREDEGKFFVLNESRPPVSQWDGDERL